MPNNEETVAPLGELFDMHVAGASRALRVARARAASLTFHLRNCLAEEAPEGWHPTLSRLAAELPALEQEGLLPQPLLSALRAGESQVRSLMRESPALRHGPWVRQRVPERVARIPGMDGAGSVRYYCWIGRQLEGHGDVAEVGCWLGQSTAALATGILAGRAGRTTTVQAYDSFVWMPWMNAYIEPHRAVGEDFLPSFRRSVAPFDVDVRPHRRRFGQPGADVAEPMPVPERPVELLVYDLGPDRDALDECWAVFSPALIRGRSLVVFNEYASVRAAEIWDFCAAHRNELVPVHKPYGTLKTFRFL